MRIFLLIVCSFLFASSQAQVLDPVDFNNRMADISDSLFYKGQAWGTKLNEVQATGEYKQLKPLREDIEMFIAASIEQLKTPPKVGDGSELLVRAMMDYLMYEKNLVQQAFIPFESLTNQSGDEEIRQAMNNLTTLAKDEGIELVKLNDAQEAYAAKNGFSIGVGEEEK